MLGMSAQTTRPSAIAAPPSEEMIAAHLGQRCRSRNAMIGSKPSARKSAAPM